MISFLKAKWKAIWLNHHNSDNSEEGNCTSHSSCWEGNNHEVSSSATDIRLQLGRRFLGSYTTSLLSVQPHWLRSFLFLGLCVFLSSYISSKFPASLAGFSFFSHLLTVGILHILVFPPVLLFFLFFGSQLYPWLQLSQLYFSVTHHQCPLASQQHSKIWTHYLAPN